MTEALAPAGLGASTWLGAGADTGEGTGAWCAAGTARAAANYGGTAGPAVKSGSPKAADINSAVFTGATN